MKITTGSAKKKSEKREIWLKKREIYSRGLKKRKCVDSIRQILWGETQASPTLVQNNLIPFLKVYVT